MVGRGPGAAVTDLAPALTADFDHVSYLGIVGTAGSELADADVQPLLANFRGLRRLGIEAAQLTRLPSAIEHMPHLQRLHLGGNDIVLTPEDVLRLKDRVHLKELFLDMNPLGLATRCRAHAALTDLAA